MTGNFEVFEARLPLAGLTALAEDAWEEDFAFLNRLIADWGDGTNCFDKEGECLLAVRQGNLLIGIGGLNRDPYLDDEDTRVGRIRRFYVRPSHRRSGVGMALLEELVSRARGHFDILRLRTPSVGAAAEFYEACGFEPVEEDGATHIKDLG